MITWKDTLEIIATCFDTNQSEIAKRLNVSKSTLSKIKNGKQAATFGSEDTYKKIFDPDNSGSLAYGFKNTKENHLKALKEIIGTCHPNVQEELKDCWDGTTYEEFVKRLLSRTISVFSKGRDLAEVNSVPEKREVEESDVNQLTCATLLRLVQEYNVMDIVGRVPARFCAEDADVLRLFLDIVDPVFVNRDKYIRNDMQLSALVGKFIERIYIMELTITGNLNWKKSDLVDMDETEEREEVSNPCDIPTIEEAAAANKNFDILGLQRLAVSEWSNYRREVENLYSEIIKWQKKHSSC